MYIARVPLRQINTALRLTLPLKLTRKRGLTAYDSVDVFEEDDKVILAFVKVEPPAEVEAVNA
jgi:hypothetical protein